MKQNKILLGHLLAFLTILVWGTTYASTKLLLEAFSAIQIICMRFAAAYVLLWILYPRKLQVKSKKDELCFAFAGFSGITLYYLTENIAISYTYASLVGILVSVAPFLTGLLVWAVFGKKLKKLFVAGFILAFAGVCMVTVNGTEVLGLNYMGSILALAAALSWAAYSTVMEEVSKQNYPMLGATRRIFFYGMVLLIPVIIFSKDTFSLQPLKNPVILGNLLFLAVFASTIGYVVWNYAIAILGTVKCSAYIYLSPIVSMISSAVILGEKITPLAVAGTALILAGLVLSEYEKKESFTKPGLGKQRKCPK